jgi:molybdopterin synthase sulfur carrier subunit|tara:strand:- start:44 stop:343 length:300 start_codon:yes stop_codon:yes gene_type:complete
MGVMVRVPTPLRKLTAGLDKLEVDAGSISGLINHLEASYPGFHDRLLDEAGDLRYFVNIYVNGEDVRFLEGLETAVKMGDEVSIVPAVAGGEMESIHSV